MNIQIIPDDFAQAKAILRDAILKDNADFKNRETIGILKLLKAREENIDFEITLAEKICGDNSNYPYRSSFYITKFFNDLGYSYSHDGTTRRLWIKDILLQLDITQIAALVKNGLFRKSDYKNPRLRTVNNNKLNDDEFLQLAISDFKKFIDESIRANEVVDLEEVLNLNVNIDLLFESNPITKDDDLNKLVNEAKDRYLKPNDQVVALEKIWDAFERIKTYYDPDKKKSASILIGDISTELDESEFRNEFETLTKIGNTYRIRHHEIDKKPITDPLQIKYLFFRMLSLIDLAIETLRIKENSNEF
jgi:hypothetical protein